MSSIDAPTDVVRMTAVRVVVDGTLILGPIDLAVGAGERWALLGPNGSGKTTLLALAGARRQPSAGTVAVLGTTLGRGDVRGLHQRISHFSHVLAELVPPRLSAEEVVLTGKRSALVPWFETYDEEDRRWARLLLARLGCEDLDGRPFMTGSQGERQRVLLARSLFASPELLILDEPSAGLDLPGRESVIAAMEAAAALPGATTSLLATHHLEEIPPSTTHAALLREGRLVAAGGIEDILTESALSSCFGMPMRLGRRERRWWAAADPARSAALHAQDDGTRQ